MTMNHFPFKVILNTIKNLKINKWIFKLQLKIFLALYYNIHSRSDTPKYTHIHINVLYNGNVKFSNTLFQFKLIFENYIKLKCVCVCVCVLCRYNRKRK